MFKQILVGSLLALSLGSGAALATAPIEIPVPCPDGYIENATGCQREGGRYGKENPETVEKPNPVRASGRVKSLITSLPDDGICKPPVGALPCSK